MTAEINIQIALNKDKTYLKNCFFTTPLKLANITEDKSHAVLHLMLMSSSPGILDGDSYCIKIELEKGCSLQLQTQSYQRLFNMKKSASQRMEVYMDKGSSFCFLPHPTVPHKASDFTAINKIHLSESCKLIWGEVLTCGRKLSGEEFQFLQYQNSTEIFLNKRLVVKENLVVKPSTTDVRALGQFEGYSHQASLIYLDETADVNKLISNIKDCLSGKQNISFGISALHVNGIIVRLLGHKGEQLHKCLQTITGLFFAKEFCNILPETLINQ